MLSIKRKMPFKYSNKKIELYSKLGKINSLGGAKNRLPLIINFEKTINSLTVYERMLVFY